MITFATWLTLHQSVPYVVSAYLVFLAVIVIYVAIMARRVARGQKDLAELRRQLEDRQAAAVSERESEPVG
jgi:flagellar biosynthesis/type III secretory pathway M-ring protein FliF/YscJ